MDEIIAKAAVLIEALPYIQQFRGVTVVVKFGGSAMDDPGCVESTLRDIVFMELVGMKPVIVHGGGKKISSKMRELGMQTQFIHGLRYTCEENNFGGRRCASRGGQSKSCECYYQVRGESAGIIGEKNIARRKNISKRQKNG